MQTRVRGTPIVKVELVHHRMHESFRRCKQTPDRRKPDMVSGLLDARTELRNCFGADGLAPSGTTLFYRNLSTNAMYFVVTPINVKESNNHEISGLYAVKGTMYACRGVRMWPPRAAEQASPASDGGVRSGFENGAFKVFRRYRKSCH